MPAFEIGKYEVTFDDYDVFFFRFRVSGGRPIQAWSRGRRPVIDVSWDDAKAYVEWLSRITGEPYRLPSEAEWEYAARAGTKAPFSLPAPDGSDDITGKGLANCDRCGSEWDSRQTAPVGSFNANEFGLHDTAGNVWNGWRTAGTPATKMHPTTAGRGCKRTRATVVTGGSEAARGTTDRGKSGCVSLDVLPGSGTEVIGFRVARTLSRSENVTP